MVGKAEFSLDVSENGIRGQVIEVLILQPCVDPFYALSMRLGAIVTDFL